MAYSRREHEVDLDRIAAYLQDAVNKIKTEEDIEVLSNLKKVFKKNVPFSLRGYVAAYLLKNARISGRFAGDSKKEDKFKRDRDNRENRAEKNSYKSEKSEKSERSEKTEKAPRPVLDAALTDTIFISVGRNRRVFPRDLVGLICSVVGLDRERIGEIRVLANYSFVQLFKEDADKVINTLNGYDYRGRKLSVSFSKAKDEAGETSDTGASENPVFDEKIPENIENVSAKVEDSFTKENADTMAQQAAFAAQQAAAAEMTDEEIMAARAPRSSSSED